MLGVSLFSLTQTFVLNGSVPGMSLCDRLMTDEATRMYMYAQRL